MKEDKKMFLWLFLLIGITCALMHFCESSREERVRDKIRDGYWQVTRQEVINSYVQSNCNNLGLTKTLGDADSSLEMGSEIFYEYKDQAEKMFPKGYKYHMMAGYSDYAPNNFIKVYKYYYMEK